MGPCDWATSFYLMLITRGTQDLLSTVCLFQDIIEFYDGWFISVKPDVCIEVFVIVGGVATALSSEPRSRNTSGHILTVISLMSHLLSLLPCSPFIK